MRSKSAQSLIVFGAYLICLGAVLVLVPHIFLAVLNLPATDEVWIRAVGILLVGHAIYYIQVGRYNLTVVFPWTVYTRSSMIVFWGVMVILELVKPVVLVGGLIDLMAALWTAIAIRADRISPGQPR